MSAASSTSSDFLTAIDEPDEKDQELSDISASSGVTVPPSSNSSTALPISSPPASFNTLDLLDERTADSSTTYYDEDEGLNPMEDWHDVPTREDVLDYAANGEHPTASYTYTYQTMFEASSSSTSSTTITPKSRRKVSSSSKVYRNHDPLMWPLTKDMFVIVVIGAIMACMFVMLARPVTVAWVINEGYYD